MNIYENLWKSMKPHEMQASVGVYAQVLLNLCKTHEKRGGAKVCGKTQDPASPGTSCPQTQAGSPRGSLWTAGYANARRPSVGPGGGLDPLEGQRSGWIVCRRSHYHAGLWPTPSNEYRLKFYEIESISIGILWKSIGILWTSIGILWISVGILRKSIGILLKL